MCALSALTTNSRCAVCLPQVSDYWYTVVAMNDYQKQRFVERVIGAMFNTVAGKVRRGARGQGPGAPHAPCVRAGGMGGWCALAPSSSEAA